LLLSGDVHPVDAMAVDEALLRAGEAPTLRLYRWHPHGVSLGYFQGAAEFPWDRFAREGVPVVRRPTGGGAIFHGDEVTFSITADANDPLFEGSVRASYDRVHDALARALERWCGRRVAVGPRGDAKILSDLAASPWCFHESTPFDVVAASRKLVGSAQRRTGGRVLHHGSIVLRANRFTPETASVEGLGGDPDPNHVEEALARGLEDALSLGFERRGLSPAEESLARELARARYGNDAWTRRA
jgi:lipoate-protein ligase A